MRLREVSLCKLTQLRRGRVRILPGSVCLPDVCF